MALDPESRLVVSLVVGKRTADATHALVRDFRRRTGGRVMRLMTSDEYPAYAEAIRDAYGTRVTTPRTGRRGRPRNPYTTIPPEVTYATAHKEKENNRVVRVSTRVVFGTAAAVALAVAAPAVGRVVNTSFVERHNGTDRNRCSRKVRKGYAFSKDWDVHRATTVFSYFSYNFCWPVRTLRVKDEHGRWQKRTPGDGCRVSGSRVVLVGVGDLPRQACAAQVGHHPHAEGPGFQGLLRVEWFGDGHQHPSKRGIIEDDSCSPSVSSVRP